MNYFMTFDEIKQNRKRIIIAIIAAVVAVVIVLCGVLFANRALKEQGANSIQQAIISTAKQCAAIEGAYPSTLSYLEENYGLTVNHNDYIITYETFGSNIMPSVVVIPR